MARARHRKSNSTATFPKHLERRADKRTRAELKRHGFQTTKRGVIIDGPRNRKREPIKGARVSILKGGVIQTSVDSRRDYIVGLTPEEKQLFALDPAAFLEQHRRMMRERFPNLRGARIQTRIQWGAYQGTKDFSPSMFSKQYALTKATAEERRRARKAKRKPLPLIDAMTGIHYVVHVRKSKRGKKK